jgi:hypothetical protein
MAIRSDDLSAAHFADALRCVRKHSFTVPGGLRHSGGFRMDDAFATACTSSRRAFNEIAALLEHDASTVEGIAACFARRDAAAALRLLSDGKGGG